MRTRTSDEGIWYNSHMALKGQKENEKHFVQYRAEQIVSGIGFIGAGAIMVQSHSVHGITTAAGVWVFSAGIGMAVASGLYAVAIAATVLSLIGLELLGWFFRNRKKAAEGEDVAKDGLSNERSDS